MTPGGRTVANSGCDMPQYRACDFDFMIDRDVIDYNRT
jgi:hypothetical protein